MNIKKNVTDKKNKFLKNIKNKLKFLIELKNKKDNLKKNIEVKKKIKKEENCKKFIGILKDKLKNNNLKNEKKSTFLTYNKILNLFYKRSKLNLCQEDFVNVKVNDFLKSEKPNFKISKNIIISLNNLSMNDLKLLIKRNTNYKIIKKSNVDINSPLLKKVKNKFSLNRKKTDNIITNKNVNNNNKINYKKKYHKFDLKNIFEAKEEFEKHLNNINKGNYSEKKLNKKKFFSIGNLKSKKNSIFDLKYRKSKRLEKLNTKKKSKINYNLLSNSDSYLIPFEENLSKNYNKVWKLKNKKYSLVRKDYEKYLNIIKFNIEKCNKNFLYKNK